MIILGAFSLLALFAGPGAAESAQAKLRVEVSASTTTRVMLLLRLYKRGGGFPTDAKKALREVKVRSVAATPRSSWPAWRTAATRWAACTTRTAMASSSATS
jgi:hypothetical protein